ncbi:hypothetical protein N7468_006361 [Penicillium chermesinum]|uniref:Nuclear control of ATPase protein 2 n=1 Tax=Penicillium chermesinum TaxID=63820 RepID=A0A9W9NS24_9EURO|nr:uncharacterized protein N7468_006361 [Penicillium chermesinum]KAJ5225136.1 hypothetical protein N7468_006361 [Penicillium chermesinum]KAJ6140452.1 hypothetical protein N7470_010248 [Penicillium chermesinum]
MSIVQENACGVNVQLDRLQHQIIRSEQVSASTTTTTTSYQARRLQNIIDSFSITSKTQPLLSAPRLAELLSDPAISYDNFVSAETTRRNHEIEYLWLIAAKAAVQASGLAMHTLLDRTLELHEESEYWTKVLGSPWYSGLYAAQTSPKRLWNWSKQVFRGPAVQGQDSASLSASLGARWDHFYQIALQNIREMADSSLQLKLSSPVRLCRAEIRQKKHSLLVAKDIHTTSLGLLMERWLSFQAKNFIGTQGDGHNSEAQWQDLISETVFMTEAILKQAPLQSTSSQFEKSVEKTVTTDMTSVQVQSSKSPDAEKPRVLIKRLQRLVQDHLPNHRSSMSNLVIRDGRPSRLMRFWLPASAALLSASVSLRILIHYQDEIMQWILGLGSTIIDFGVNWVVEPVRKLIGTIRHDEKSEIAIMSKNSLVADRASLERMVIDFVHDRPDSANLSTTPEDTSAIANAVKEGDLTPVLKAYERDLRSPLTGTIRGDLVRALLIQIQKTKVDVEIAISGINSLLKSQELVFGFIGLTPGILVSYTTLQWLGGLFNNRQGLRRGKQRHELRRGLRNINRILTSASVTNGVISYKDSGRLLCESEVLLRQVFKAIGGRQYREFSEDIQDLLDIQGGVKKQLRVLERIQWTYFP